MAAPFPPAPRSLSAHAEALAPYWEVHRPSGSGPFPVAIQLHGCGGKKPFQTRWAQVAVAAGAAAIVIDSHAPRGISRLEAYATVCTGLQLHGRERAGDLLAAIAWAGRQPWADADRIIAAGWSHGGWTTLDAMALRPGQIARATGIAEAAPPRLAAAFVVYPYCGIGCLAAAQGLYAHAPITAIIGGRDSVVGAPMGAFRRFAEAGAEVRTHYFPEATHAFDEPEAADWRVRHDPALTAQAHAIYRELIISLRRG